MTIKTTLVALVLALSPGLAFASCEGEVRQTTSACAEGQVWDGASQTCVTLPTS